MVRKNPRKSPGNMDDELWKFSSLHKHTWADVTDEGLRCFLQKHRVKKVQRADGCRKAADWCCVHSQSSTCSSATLFKLISSKETRANVSFLSQDMTTQQKGLWVDGSSFWDALTCVNTTEEEEEEQPYHGRQRELHLPLIKHNN